MNFKGQVWKRVWKMTSFWSEKFGELGGTPPPRIPRSTPPGYKPTLSDHDCLLPFTDQPLT